MSVTINTINNFTSDLEIDPGSSGDSFIQFSINTTGEFRIGVDDTDDSFRFSQGSALGTNDTFIMTAAGERTMPLQPAFLAYLATDDANVTGDGTNFNLGDTDVGTSLTEVFDQNADLNPGASGGAIFTSPIDGRYTIQMEVNFRDVGSSTATQLLCRLVTSNRIYGNFIGVSNVTPADTCPSQVSSLCDMDASDTATFLIDASGGSKTIDIDGATNLVTWISGELIC